MPLVRMQVRLKWLMAVVALVACAAALVSRAIKALDERHINVLITNKTGALAQNVQVWDQLGKTSLGDLQPGSSASFLMHPAGKSSILYSYTDARGIRQTIDTGIEVERRYGYLSLQMTPSGYSANYSIGPGKSP